MRWYSLVTCRLHAAERRAAAAYALRIRAAAGFPAAGAIISNELLDAFPSHRIGWNAAKRDWFEWAVGWRDGGGLACAPGLSLCMV